MMGKILIIAGEASGERHAADLVQELRRLDSSLTFAGIGGAAMRAAGVSLRYHISQMAILGFAEVIRHLPFIRRVQRTLTAELKKGVRAVILVDYPGFNMRMARIAHGLNVPVIYYISPQLWAWGERRVDKVRRYVDLMLVLFRFEEAFYAGHGIRAHFVGHPLVDQVDVPYSETEFHQLHGLAADRPILGIFPGSRVMEVRNLLPVMLSAAEIVREQFPVQPVISRAEQLPEGLFDEIAARANVPVITGSSHALMKFSHVAMVASGTATLECGYLQTPMVVLYAVSPLTYWLGRLLIKIDTIALANIVAGEKVVPEFIQKDITVDAVSTAVRRYFTDVAYYRQVQHKLGQIKEALGEGGASRRAAEQIVEFLTYLPGKS